MRHIRNIYYFAVFLQNRRTDTAQANRTPSSLTNQQRAKLETYARGCSTEARVVLRAPVVLRARIVLLAGEGKRDLKIAHLLSIVPRTAACWRSRFLHDGIAGLEIETAEPKNGVRLHFIAPCRQQSCEFPNPR
jgi:hypothetical protein